MESPAEFWTRCCEALGPEARSRGYCERRIGNTPELVDQLLDLIISGDKRGTYSLPEELARAGTTPTEGDHVILTRHGGEARHSRALLDPDAGRPGPGFHDQSAGAGAMVSAAGDGSALSSAIQPVDLRAFEREVVHQPGVAKNETDDRVLHVVCVHGPAGTELGDGD